MTWCLFVGGDYDGEVIDVDTSHEYFMMPSKIKVPFPTIGNSTTMHSYSSLSYKREVFADSDQEHAVYMIGDVARPMRTLLNGYAKLAARTVKLEKEKTE